jgi:hypothetical protein
MGEVLSLHRHRWALRGLERRLISDRETPASRRLERSFLVLSSRHKMPLNYSKWDQLEVGLSSLAPKPISIHSCSVQLSDDSDIEGHPNVDKKSLIMRVFRHVVASNVPFTS